MNNYSAKSVPDAKLEEYRQRTLDSSFKGAVIASLDEIVYLNKMNVKNFTFRVCREPIFMAQVAIFFQKSSYMKEAFDQKIKLLKSNGLINYWISKYIDYSYLNVKQPKKGPERLNLSQLLGGFKVWMFGLCFSLLSFILEFLFKLTSESIGNRFYVTN